MAEELNVQSTEQTTVEPEKTFTQAEVNDLISKRLERERRKMPNEDEITAFRTWKASQQTEQKKMNAIVLEKDSLSGQLASLQTEFEQLQRQHFLIKKGYAPDEAEFYAYKIGKTVTDDMSFEKAAEQFLKNLEPKESKPEKTASISFGPSMESNKSALSFGDIINQKLRGGI